MEETIIVCSDCKKDSDKIRVTLIVGDGKFLNPGTRVEGGRLRCGRCTRPLLDNEKFYKIDKPSE